MAPETDLTIWFKKIEKTMDALSLNNIIHLPNKFIQNSYLFDKIKIIKVTDIFKFHSRLYLLFTNILTNFQSKYSKNYVFSIKFGFCCMFWILTFKIVIF